MEQASMARLQIRLPKDCKAFLEQRAAHNVSSQNSEIVRLIRAAMSKEKTAPGDEIGVQAPDAAETRA